MTSNIPTKRIRDITFPPPPALAEPECRLDRSVRRLNLNESRLAPSPHAVEAMRQAIEDVNAYPDHGCTALAEVISSRIGVDADRLTFGNGSGEILVAAAMVALEPGDEAVFPSPTFPTCPKGAQIAGGKLITVAVTDEGVNDIDAMLAAITPATRLFYICSPNNPTGGVVAGADLARAIDEVPDNCLLVVDEAYCEFAALEGSADVLALLKKRAGPWITTRTFSKAYALSGMRIGYGICSNDALKQGIWQLRPNFNVNRIGLAAAHAAYQDEDHLRSLLQRTIEQRQKLANGLQQLGCKPFPSGANFLTVGTPCPAGELAASLAAAGILVQDMPWPGHFGSIRITIGTNEDTEAVIDAVSRFIEATP